MSKLTGTMAVVLGLAVVAPAFAQAGRSTPTTMATEAATGAGVRREQLTDGGIRFNGRYAGWQPAGPAGSGTGASTPSNTPQPQGTGQYPNPSVNGAYYPVYQYPSNSYPPSGYHPVYHNGYVGGYRPTVVYVYGPVNGYTYGGYLTQPNVYVPTPVYVYPNYGGWGSLSVSQGPVVLPG